jgi:hypothetical protein
MTKEELKRLKTLDKKREKAFSNMKELSLRLEEEFFTLWWKAQDFHAALTGEYDDDLLPEELVNEIRKELNGRTK